MPQACRERSWVVELGPDSHARALAKEVMVGCAFISLSLVCSQAGGCVGAGTRPLVWAVHGHGG
jgi:hypothetical protein